MHPTVQKNFVLSIFQVFHNIVHDSCFSAFPSPKSDQRFKFNDLMKPSIAYGAANL
jgi:hypothetical protein